MWFTRSIEDVLKSLQVDPAIGLSDDEVKSRQAHYGLNKLQEKKKKTILQLFLAQLQDWLIYILFAAIVITLFLGEHIDAIIIFLVILTNAVLGVAQEVKAGKAIDALRKLSSPRTLVKRNGTIREIDSAQVVPGDIIILEAGRFISADLRLLEDANLQIDESALTGESLPVAKDAKSISTDPDTSLGDRTNCAYMSTLVTYGRGVGVAVETGMQTQVGQIAELIEEEEMPTPLEIRLEELGKLLGKIAIAVCALFFLIAVLQGRNLPEMFLTAVSLAVASIPEGLAAIVAVVLSIGVTNMSKRNAIVKRLPAVETLGSVNMVCSDKTGTLTQNKMTVTKFFTLDQRETAVDQHINQTVPTDAQFLAKAMTLCSDATFADGKGTGDPTEIALLIFADDLGIDRQHLAAANERIGEFSFDSDRKLMSTLSAEDGKLTVYTKGAIDNLLTIATRVLIGNKVVPITAEHKNLILAATDRMSDQALRVLAAAYKPVKAAIKPEEMEKDLIFIGMVGMIDPPRDEVKLSIQKAKRAGITTIMITGDHKNTAAAIANDLNIARSKDQAITGQEIDGYTDEEFADRIDHLRIFARVSPMHKVKIVRALKAKGHIVSMTGDGVNDAPSLTSADIGVAMGITGTDAAKSASDMILTDDNFATIISAIEQGRNIYNNIKKSVIFLLTSNLGEVVAMFFAILAGMPAPLLATQLLWINLLTDSLPAVALGMDPGDPDVMNEKPRSLKESFFAHGAGLHVIAGGVLIGLLTLFAFWYGFYEHGYSPLDRNVPDTILDYARTMAFMTIISSQLWYSMAFRHHSKSIFQIGLVSNRYLIGAIILGLLLQLVIIGIPAMQAAFKLQMLDLQGWIHVVLLGAIPLVSNELIKIALRKKYSRSFIET
ncbi:MAG TPA: cation-translocating P-type ATPase [bacterium]|nr:cation-translocating P-type ATPase [bacterium]